MTELIDILHVVEELCGAYSCVGHDRTIEMRLCTYRLLMGRKEDPTYIETVINARSMTGNRSTRRRHG